MSENKTLRTGYFDDMYDKNEDPWDFQTSDYEKNKYQATVDILPKAQYQNAFEIGCSIGVLTEKLAAKCKKLFSVDISESPVEKARKRLANYPQVSFAKMELPKEFPEQIFDLIIMSEIGYYFSLDDLALTQCLIMDHLATGGQLLMVHWTPEVHNYPLTGDQVHDFFFKLAEAGGSLRRLDYKREEKYRIDLFEKI